MERERQASSEARTDLQKRAGGAEDRAEKLQCFTKDLTQKLRDMEQRLQKVRVGVATTVYARGTRSTVKYNSRELSTNA